MAKLQINGCFNFIDFDKNVIESGCSCGDCGVSVTKIEEGDTVEVLLPKGMFITTKEGAVIRTKEFTIYKLPKKQ